MKNLRGVNGAIFVISLTDSPRRKHIENQFSKIGLDFEFINAVNGKTEDFSTNPMVDWRKCNAMTNTEIAISLSHIKCYQKIVSENLEFAVIFEDDICFYDEIGTIIKSIHEYAKLPSVAMLFYQGYSAIELKSDTEHSLTEKYSLYSFKEDQLIFSAAGYYINRTAASEMLNYLLPVFSAADSWSQFRNNKLFSQFYAIFPLPCYNALFASELNHGKNLKAKVIESIGNILNRVKLPFLQKILRNRRKKYYSSTQKIFIK